MPLIIEVPDIPWIKTSKPTKGFAFFPFIFVTDKRDTALVYHEKIHIRQQVRGFLIFFFIKYIYYHLKYGYQDNPYEVEARQKTEEWKASQ